MSFVVEGLGRSAQVDEAGNVEREYVAVDYSDEIAAEAAVLAFIVSDLGDPPLRGSLLLRSIKARETNVKDTYRAVATWGVFQEKTPTAEGSNDYAFEFELETVHINTAIDVTPYDLPSFTAIPAPDIGRAIGWNPKDKTIGGIDIEEPVYSWSETHYKPLADLTSAYKNAIGAILQAPVNNGTFRGYDAGEVKITGVSGQQRGATDAALTFRFKQRPNQSISFGGATIDKKGWERLEILYDRSDAVMPGKFILPKAIGAYVQQVYETSDFAGLAI